MFYANLNSMRRFSKGKILCSFNRSKSVRIHNIVKYDTKALFTHKKLKEVDVKITNKTVILT